MITTLTTTTTTESFAIPWLLSLLLFLFVTLVSCKEEANSINCQDHFEECDYWKTTGMCNRPYMRTHCPKSCEESAQKTPCIHMGVPQYMGGTYAHRIQDIVEESSAYIMTTTTKEQDFLCHNQHRECASWAAAGQCLTNPGFMQVQCAPVCQSCDKVNFESRCAFTENDNVWRVGDVRRVMEKLESSDNVLHYSQSSLLGTRTKQPPYVVVLENFITEKESKQLLEQEREWEYEYIEQQVEDDVFERVINQHRNYSSTLCGQVCEQQQQQDALLTTLLERIEQVTGIPKVNAEYMELRRYEQGQGKALDGDYQEFELQHAQGVRIATMHIFLSDGHDNDDNAAGGGAIHIPSLNVTIPSKLGRAVLWANVLDSNPDWMDPTMLYAIEPPVTPQGGTQYSATVYLHQRDYKTAEKWACHQPQKNDALHKNDIL